MARRGAGWTVSALFLAALVVAGPAGASVTGRVSRVGGTELRSLLSTSSDGRYVVASASLSGEQPVLVDRSTGAVQALAGGDEASRVLVLDGGASVLVSTSASLVGADTDGGATDVYRLPVVPGSPVLLTGGLPDTSAYEAWDASADGSVLALSTVTSGSGQPGVLRYVPATGVTTGLSAAAFGLGGDGTAQRPSMSADGRYTGFLSNGGAFVADAVTGATSRLDVIAARPSGSAMVDAWVADSGRQGAFTLAQPSAGTTETFLYRRDLAAGNAELVNTGVDTSDLVLRQPLSSDGSRLVFIDRASGQLMLYDTAADQIEQVTRPPLGVASDGPTSQATIVGSGSVILFASAATNLVEEPTPGPGVFVRSVTPVPPPPPPPTTVPGTVPTPAPAPTPVTEVPAFQPISPKRLLDTRTGGQTEDGRFAGIGVRPAGERFVLPVGGRLATLPATMAAVALNVTVVAPGGSGYLTVWPCSGDGPPNASNLNYVAGQVVPNMVLVPVDAAGEVCLQPAETGTHLLVDVYGYFPVGAAIEASTPQRLLDTRPGGTTIDGAFAGEGRRPAGARLELTVAGRGGVAAGASAVVLNVTATDPSGAGYLTVWPCETDAPPNASNLNFSAGRTVPNSVIVPLSGERDRVHPARPAERPRHRRPRRLVPRHQELRPLAAGAATRLTASGHIGRPRIREPARRTGR